MAKVEMTGFEYMELMDKARKLDSLKQKLVGAVEVKVDVDEDEGRVSVRAYYDFTYPDELLRQIRDNVAEQLAKEPKAVKYLYKDDSPCFVVSSGYFTRDWGTNRDNNTVDLRENANFRKVWQACEQEEEEEE